MFLKCFYCQKVPYIKCRKCKLFLCSVHLAGKGTATWSIPASAIIERLCNPCWIKFVKIWNSISRPPQKNKKCLTCLIRPTWKTYCCNLAVCDDCGHEDKYCPLRLETIKKFLSSSKKK